MPEDLPLLTPGVIAAASVELAFMLAGAFLIWRCWFSAAARAARAQSARLPTWDLPAFPFMGLVASVLVGGLIGQMLVVKLGELLIPGLKRSDDLWLMLAGAGFQLGMLGCALGGYRYTKQLVPRASAAAIADTAAMDSASRGTRLPRPIMGLATFLCALPVLAVINLPWTSALERFGFSTESQEMVDLLLHPESPATVVIMIVLAVVVAPVTEELIFRAGLFRYLRTRLPRAWALALPAIVFGALHGNYVAFLPLVAFGVILSLAYERTGSILVPMVAHSLFNLNTILLVIAGVSA